ncbi:MAG: ribosome biogenesis GTP-binding protein YihA/YsxC [Bacillota bacterium]
MDIRHADFITSAVNQNQYPLDGLPELALVGRSNVGKSSLINCIAGRRNLARTSNQPGRTRTLNYYRFNHAWYLVDLPGYGYAKVSKTEREALSKMNQAYLLSRGILLGVFQLIDIRHQPMEQDVEVHRWLRERGLMVTVVASKADKISKGRQLTHLRQIRQGLGLQEGDQCIPFSAITAQGKEPLLEIIEGILLARGLVK